MSSLPKRASSSAAPISGTTLSPTEQLQFARTVIRQEASHLMDLASRIDMQITNVADLLLQCRGAAVVTGIGKAGIVGQKLSATLASTGTRSHFVHSAEAVHGDLGRIHDDDVVIVLSHSGKTEEIVRILPSLAEQAHALVAITAEDDSPLGEAADIVISIGKTVEACSLGLAPSTSTTAMIAVGDALALLVSRLREFAPTDFAKFHPGGSLGVQLSRVDDIMRPVGQCRIASDKTSVREVLVNSSLSGRRTGAVMLVDSTGVLTGVFTDSDLARLLERRRESSLDQPIADVMSRDITTIQQGSLLPEALDLLVDRKISELPVIDQQCKPIGLIDITDVVGLMPPNQQTHESPNILRFPSPSQ